MDGFNWLKIRYNGGFLEHSNERSVSIEVGEFLDRLRGN
jgi:hypothetical protein